MPEFEAERPRSRQPDPIAASVDETQAPGFQELVTGLRIMTHARGELAFDFARAAAQLAGEPDFPERLHGMIAFAVAYHNFGFETAMEGIIENSGVRVPIIVGADGKGATERPGILVGLLGIQARLRGPLSFDGVAMIEDKRGRERFVAVSVSPDGETQLHRDQYDYHKPDWVSDREIEDIFPPSKPRRPKRR